MTFSADFERELKTYPPTAWLIRNRYPLLFFTPVILAFALMLFLVVVGVNTNWTGEI